ncbi:MAG: F-box-like domain-containing protein [Sulfobacillus sp.]
MSILLNELPDEVLATVFQYLTPKQISQVTRVSSQFNRICKEWYWEARAKSKWYGVDARPYRYDWQQLCRDSYLKGRSYCFCWRIDNFFERHQNAKEKEKERERIYSPEFELRGLSWRVLLFPAGNRDHHCLAMYLEPMPKNQSDSGTRVPWYHADMSFSVCGADEESVRTRKCHHIFNGKDPDWGFTSFMDFKELFNPNNLFLVDGALCLEVTVVLSAVPDYLGYYGIGLFDPDEKDAIQKFVDHGYHRESVEKKFLAFRLDHDNWSQDNQRTGKFVYP